MGLGGIAVYGYSNGDVPRLLAPVDADGRFCGIDTEVKDYHLYYIVDINVSKDFFNYGVCVKSCPSEGPVECVPTEKVPDCNDQSFQTYKTIKLLNRLCLPDYNQSALK